MLPMLLCHYATPRHAADTPPHATTPASFMLSLFFRRFSPVSFLRFRRFSPLPISMPARHAASDIVAAATLSLMLLLMLLTLLVCRLRCHRISPHVSLSLRYATPLMPPCFDAAAIIFYADADTPLFRCCR